MTDTTSRKSLYLFYGMLILFAVWRMLYLHADPSGYYQNTDEDHHIADARKIVMYGTPFYDNYNPSVLMPMFTAFEVPFLAVFGVNHVGIRMGSICSVIGAMWLMGRLLMRRGQALAGLLLVFWVGVSFFAYSHSRCGIQDPVLMFFSALTAYWFCEALETNKSRHYVFAFLSALAVPLTKTSGVFIYGMIGGCLLYKWIFAPTTVNWKGVVTGLVASGMVLLLVFLFWFLPHWDYLVFFYKQEVVSKQTQAIMPSIKRLIFATVDLAPFITLLCLAAVFRIADRLLKEPQRCDNLDLVLFFWLISAYMPLVYASVWFPRWMMWMLLPLGMLGIRELTRLCAEHRADLRQAFVGCFLIGTLVGNWSFYSSYFRTMSFHLYILTPFVERMVGTNIVSGSGLTLPYSDKLNIVYNYEYTKRNQDCAEIQQAYPPGKTPQYIGWHVGNNPSKFQEKMQAWYAACPEWKQQYQPFMINQRIDFDGVYDIWLIRTNTPISGPLKVISPQYDFKAGVQTYDAPSGLRQ